MCTTMEKNGVKHLAEIWFDYHRASARNLLYTTQFRNIFIDNASIVFDLRVNNLTV